MFSAIRCGLVPSHQSFTMPDVLDIIVRTGTGAAASITSALGLNVNGGLILTKNRTSTNAWALSDTVRGLSADLVPTTTAAETSQPTGVTAVTSTGYTLGTLAKRNGSGLGMVDYVMRQSPRFLQILTLAAGDAVNVPHNLGVAPGMILAKSRNLVGGWCVWHRYGDPGTPGYGATGFSLNATSAARYNSAVSMTASTFNTEFYGWDGTTEKSAWDLGNAVHYVFAHDPSPTGRIFCGGYIGNGSATGPVVTLGWAPRLLIIKCTTAAGGWVVLDTARGITATNDQILFLNTTAAQVAAQRVNLTGTGFQVASTDASINTSAQRYAFVAIR